MSKQVEADRVDAIRGMKRKKVVMWEYEDLEKLENSIKRCRDSQEITIEASSCFNPG